MEGTIIAAKHDVSIGRSRVKLPVISVARMMPVIGARTTAVKKAAMATTANAVGSAAALGNH